jgi:serine/threonine protein kinase/WD40 repeat protein
MANPRHDMLEIFTEAMRRESPAARSQYLDEACGKNALIRQRVETLVRAHYAAGSFLGGRMPEAPRTSDQLLPIQLGTQIGPYTLVQEIGQGGMGVVYMAQQHEPVRRQVALKIIRPGMDTRQVVARFEAERQALAMMDHVNIARVLDAGTTEQGRPYFVMELVHGVPITRYCDDNRLTPRKRLELFVPVCQAIQHAHQKGIIHRDIKPSNVMVTHYDAKPVPKVIDFGVAKATEQQLTERTLLTQYGAMVGTLEYMSPEQAEMSALGVDTRSDVYSLGVLLYELLTGSTPLSRTQIKDASYAEILRMIMEEEPPRPSARLSNSGEALTSISAQRQTEPAKLSKLLRGELDWIVMKTLEKDRNRRYATANGLAADVQRYLNDDPVLACPPSAGYRCRKFARRHRRPVLAALLVLLALGCGVVGTTWGLIRTSRARADAVREAKEKSLALADKETALTAARESRRSGEERLFGSMLALAQANRRSGRPGQRCETLAVLQRAHQLARVLQLPAARFDELRNAVIATLALPDLYMTGPRHPWPADGFLYDFCEDHTLYARTDRQGNCSIRLMSDDTELNQLPGQGVPAVPLFSPDGKYITILHISAQHLPATLGVAADIWALEPQGARKVRTEPNVRSVDYHPTGRQVGLGYNDGAIAVFDVPSGSLSGPPLAPDTLTQEISIALHPTAPLVAVSSYFSRVVQIRDLRTGDVVAALPQAVGATQTAWHPDGQTLAVGYGDSKEIKLYDRTTYAVYRTMLGVQGGTGLTFNHRGDRLATNGWLGRVELFDVGTGRQLFAASGAMHRFSRDDRRLAAGVQDGRLGIWQVADGREYRTLVRQAAPTGHICAIALHPNGRLLAAGTEDGFGLWDLETGAELTFVAADSDSGVHDLCFEPSGALLTCSNSGLFRWPLVADSGAPGHVSMGPPQRLLAAAKRVNRSTDGRVLVASHRATGKWQQHAGGWILHTDRLDQPIQIDAGADILPIAVSPDGQWVVTCTFATGIARVWTAHDGRFVKQLTTWGADLPRFSSDGRWLSTDLAGDQVFVVDSWEPTRSFSASAFAASAGGLLALDPIAGVTPLCDRDTGREIARLESPAATATPMRLFTPDGCRLIDVGNAELKGIHVWDLRLIRQQLTEMKLEGEWPAFPPIPVPSTVVQPLQVTVVPWDFAGLALPRDQEALRAIEYYRALVAAEPDNALACNNLAWVYATAPEAHRDVHAALRLAEKAVQLDPKRAMYRNTLGTVYYRAERYREAVAVLHVNLATQDDASLAFDLYFLAMSHQRLGETARARDYYDWAVRWTRSSHRHAVADAAELAVFQKEAMELLGVPETTEE